MPLRPLVVDANSGAGAAAHPRHPGSVDGFLRTAELDDVEQAARDQGVTARRRQGYTLRVTVVPAVHHRLLALCGPLDGAPAAPAVPAQRKARREYENRVSTLALIGP